MEMTETEVAGLKNYKTNQGQKAGVCHITEKRLNISCDRSPQSLDLNIHEAVWDRLVWSYQILAFELIIIVQTLLHIFQ